MYPVISLFQILINTVAYLLWFVFILYNLLFQPLFEELGGTPKELVQIINILVVLLVILLILNIIGISKIIKNINKCIDYEKDYEEYKISVKYNNILQRLLQNYKKENLKHQFKILTIYFNSFLIFAVWIILPINYNIYPIFDRIFIHLPIVQPYLMSILFVILPVFIPIILLKIIENLIRRGCPIYS